jgi:hypothetical protein
MKPGERFALPKAVAKIYEAVQELKDEFPGRPFTPDGHLRYGAALDRRAANMEGGR